MNYFIVQFSTKNDGRRGAHPAITCNGQLTPAKQTSARAGSIAS